VAAEPAGDLGYADDEYPDWERPAGIFVLAPIAGPMAGVIRELQSRFDPKLAGAYVPHITLAGSSGVGPIRADTPVESIRRQLGPIADATAPLHLPFGRPQRFMQTNIVSLPLDVHGPLRALHDRIAQSGLSFGPARFTFTPHVTLNLYRTLTPETERVLMSIRLREPAILDQLVLSATDDHGPPRPVLVLRLGGSGEPLARA
jgi:2'-5' RNA ligase